MHSEEASRRTLIRRVYLDMLPDTLARRSASFYRTRGGMPTTLKVLENPSYGERWARHWLDVIRRQRRLRDQPRATQRLPLP